MRSWFSFTLRNIVEKIMSDELLTLSSNDFGKKCHEAFLGWWQNKDFADVTLATSDDCQISVHRVVLASSSQLFRSLLLKNPHPHPIVYLQGVSMKQLKPLLEYIYRGECNMQQENLDEFLNTGKYLLVTGLTQDSDEKTEPEDIKSGFKEETLPNNDIDLKALPEDANEDMFQCKKCNYTTRFAHNLTKHFNAKHTNLMHECSLCESKYSWKQQLKNHVESIHEGKIGMIKTRKLVRKKCTQCDFIAANSSSLRTHRLNIHEGKRYYCNQCDYNVAHTMNLKSHVQIVHEGIRYECNECDFKATLRKNLRRHTEGVHKGVRYDCHEIDCDYKAYPKSSLDRHMLRIHKRVDLTPKK